MSKLLCAFLLTALIADSARAADGMLPAPYQVEGVIRHRSDHQRLGDGLGLAEPLLMVDLGRADRRPHPGSRNFPEMTFIGTAGSAFGRLEDIAKSCAFLCGDEAESCHYVARYAIDRPLAALGTPLVGLVGRHDLAGLAPVPTAGDGAAIGPFAAELLAPIWSPYAGDDPAYRIRRWDPAAGTLTLDLRYGGDPIVSFATDDCAVRRTGNLTSLTCRSLAVLVDRGRPLLVSFPDYNLAAAEVVARFSSGGLTHYLIRLGLKAETLFGLLSATPDGWHAHFRRRGYPTLC